MGSPYPNQKPRQSIVSGNQQSLSLWRTTRSGTQHRQRLQYCRSRSRQHFQFVNPKRCFFEKHDEVDAAALARDTGLPPEAAVADEENWIALEGEHVIYCCVHRNLVPKSITSL